MSRNLYEPTQESRITQNRYKVKDTRQKPLASRWIWPSHPAPPDDAPDWTPALQNGAAQPGTGAGIQYFGFRIHYDGSLEFSGVLDLSGATSPAMVVVIPGANLEDPNYLSGLGGKDQPWDSIISDDTFATFTLAQFYLDASTGNLTITWPAT